MFNKLTTDLINKIIIELKKKENEEIIQQNLLNPLSNEINARIHPYMLIIFFMYILMLLLIILMLFILIKKQE